MNPEDLKRKLRTYGLIKFNNNQYMSSAERFKEDDDVDDDFNSIFDSLKIDEKFQTYIEKTPKQKVNEFIMMNRAIFNELSENDTGLIKNILFFLLEKDKDMSTSTLKATLIKEIEDIHHHFKQIQHFDVLQYKLNQLEVA